MKRSHLLAGVAFVLAGAMLAYAGGGRADQQADEFAITISPQTIVLSSQAECVSVHSNIPFSLVDADSLALDGVAPYLVKSDDRGFMVAKFDFAPIAALVAPPSATLTLTGQLKDGTPIVVSDSVVVK